jgi:hypothetical protein
MDINKEYYLKVALRRGKYLIERILRTREQLKIWKTLLGTNVKKMMVAEVFFRETYLEYE